jgi:TolA-binding protein
MVLIFFFVCLLNTGCGSIQSGETGDQSVEHKRLLLNDPQAMNDRLIDLERKLQAVNGKVASLESENSMLKSTMAANTKTTNSKIETIKSQLANVGMFYRLIVQSIHIFLSWWRPCCSSF